jgi:Flp pilus assembly protein TadG
MSEVTLHNTQPTVTPRRPRRRRGAATVEFAVIAPVFFTLVFGMIEFGRMLMVEQVLTNAAREGARTAVLSGSSNSAVNTKIQTYLTGGSVNANAATISVTPTLASAKTGDTVTVQVSIPYSSVSWLPAPWFLGNAILRGQAVMRHE